MIGGNDDDGLGMTVIVRMTWTGAGDDDDGHG